MNKIADKINKVLKQALKYTRLETDHTIKANRYTNSQEPANAIRLVDSSYDYSIQKLGQGEVIF
jgi:hypothetical protein